jgi:hypothetical protein
MAFHVFLCPLETDTTLMISTSVLQLPIFIIIGSFCSFDYYYISLTLIIREIEVRMLAD